ERLAVAGIVLLGAFGLRRRGRRRHFRGSADVARLLLSEVALLRDVPVDRLAAPGRVRLVLRAGGARAGVARRGGGAERLDRDRPTRGARAPRGPGSRS